MPESSPRGVTRGYVIGLALAVSVVAAALTVATWGLLALGIGTDPVSSAGVPRLLGPLLLGIALALLLWALWRQAIVLLLGRRTPAWGIIVTVSVGAYLVWCLGGLLAGMSTEELWLSPFAGSLVPIWAAASLMFWGVLTRRVYTDRPPPRWPWENKDDSGPRGPEEESGWS